MDGIKMITVTTQILKLEKYNSEGLTQTYWIKTSADESEFILKFPW